MTLTVTHSTPADGTFSASGAAAWDASHSITGGVPSDVGLGNVTNDTQTKAAIVPNTAPSAGQLLAGNAGGTAYAPVSVTGSGATISLSSAGVVTISAIANASLANSSITIAGTSTALGGSITQDTITGLSSTGIVKRTAANTLAIAVAGTDYEAAIAAGTTSQYWRGDKTWQTLNATAVGLGSVTNNAQTQAAIVPNTAPSAGQVLVGNAGGTAYAPVSMSGDATLASTGAITVSQARGLRETAGPTTLSMGAVADGQFLVRSGASIIGSAAGASVTVEDEGVSQGSASTFDFVGAGVSASVSGGTATITINGGSGSGTSIGLVLALPAAFN